MTATARDGMRRRLAAVQQGMQAERIDLLVVGPSADMQYFLGRRLPLTERLSVLVIPRQGVPSVVLPELQVPLLADLPIECQAVPWRETEKPVEQLAQLAKGCRRIAVSDQFWSGFLLGLQDLLPGIEYLNGSPVISRLRAIKDESELAFLREGGRRFDALWQEFLKTEKLIGRTEYQIQLRLRDMMAAQGFESVGWCDVGSGPNGASPLHHWSHRAVEPGDVVVVDFAGSCQGYYMDTAHTVVAGEPHPDFIKLYDIVKRAHETATAAIRPGVPCEEVDRAARAVIEEAGYGPRFIHRTGHGLGIDGHEHPYIVAGNRQPLEPGMVFSNEPGIYIPGRWGVRIENIMAVTADGSEGFQKINRDLACLS